MPNSVMLAALEADTIVSAKPVTVRDYSYLRRYQFKPGQAPPCGAGRPRGSKSFANILHAAAPKLAKVYVRKALQGDTSLLVDSRKVFVPLDAEQQSSSVIQVVIAGDALRSVADSSLIRDDVSSSLAPSLNAAMITPKLDAVSTLSGEGGEGLPVAASTLSVEESAHSIEESSART